MLKKVFVLLSVALLAACRSLVNIPPDPKLSDFDLKDDEALLLVGIPTGSRMLMMPGENRDGRFSKGSIEPKVVIIEGISRYNEAVSGYALRRITISEREPGMAIWNFNHYYQLGCDNKTAFVELKPKAINYFGDVVFFNKRVGPGELPAGQVSVEDQSHAAQKYITESFPLAKAIIHRPVLQEIPLAESVTGRCDKK